MSFIERTTSGVVCKDGVNVRLNDRSLTGCGARFPLPTLWPHRGTTVARILLADDCAATRRALRNLIESNAWEICAEAEDGLAAVEKTASLKPDLVILDLNMPKMTGIQAGHTIHVADPDIPLLLFTLDPIQAPLELEARDAGFRAALSKVEGIFALCTAIEQLLAGKTLFPTATTKLISPLLAENAQNETSNGLNDDEPDAGLRARAAKGGSGGSGSGGVKN
jgi:DNA-binding NarL/FixJ family response regulator